MNIDKITNIIGWVLIIIGVVFIIWKLLGGSPTEFNILIALVSGMLFKMMSIGGDVSSLKEKVKNIENKFNSLAFDFKDHIKHK